MPKKVEVSVDEYIGTRSLVSKDGIVYRAAKMPKTFNAETRSATFVMTDETVDSYGDIVRAKGCDLTRFETNPICLLNHRSDQILGTWSDVKRIVKRIEGTATLANEGTAPHIDMAYNLMSQGILRAASIGFMPTKVERRLDDNGEPLWSYDILEWQMYECSVVGIPANPAALARSMKEGSMMARDLLEEVLDNYVKMPSGVIVAIADIEAAHKAGGGEKTAVVVDIPEDVSQTLDTGDEVGMIAPEEEKDAGDDIGAVDPEGDGGDKSVESSDDAPVADAAIEPKSAVYSIEVDTAVATEKVNALSALVDSLAAKISKFFGSKAAEPEPVETPAPPTAEAIETAKAKAAASLERLTSKGLIKA